ncbi:MAG: FAD-dependent oxidoreductase [Actinomycetota bacterium]|nr:FAD-dependent oxidoreductase [Actinomycetota bacterium]
MARTPLLSGVQRAAAEAAADLGGYTRRDVLRRAGLAGAAVAVGARWAPAVNAATAPRIVIVGGGLAGLTCAYRLKQAGYAGELHEASDRLGGRCWSIRSFADGQIAEHGGELIDQGHTAIRQLAQELGLKLDNLLASQPNGSEDTYYFDRRFYLFAQATSDLKAIWQQIHSDLSAASYPTTYKRYTQRGYELDHMSIAQYIDAYVPGGRKSNLGQLLDVAYNIEYGAETSVQSSLNLLYLLAYSGQGQLRIFGPSNEKYHVTLGNDQIPQRLADALDGQITRASALVAIRRNADSTFTLSFTESLVTRDVKADHAVLALPFSMLRTVDTKKAGFSTVKQRAISQLPMGTNSKLQLQFSDRHWYGLGNNGNTYADTGYQDTWEVTRAQAGTQGILVDYTGGTIGASFGSGTLQERAQQFLAQIEPVLPGISAKYTGRATLDYWQAYPWTRGSYSYWKVGQYTSFSGAEGERSGNCHFCGEHTSQDFQGYLNGGVETGQRACDEILADLK